MLLSRRELLAVGLGGLIAADSVSSSPLGPAVTDGRPVSVGVWYTPWWDRKERVPHWAGIRIRPPLLGRYSADDPQVVRAQYQAMIACGVSFIIFDDTNTVYVDNGFIDGSIRAWYDFMDALPERARLPLCIAFGGELNQHGSKEDFLRAGDYLFQTYAHRPSQMRRDGKPFILWYIEKDVLDDWRDERFTIRRCYHFLRTPDLVKSGGWGWGAHVYPPPLPECMSIKPGWYGGPPSQPWPRRDGDYYCECWLRILKQRPAYVTIADWNNWAEETAIEDSAQWTDYYGTPTPDWYRRITLGYATLLRTGRLLSGFFYRDEHSEQIYRSSTRQLTLQPTKPHGAPVLVLPDGWLDRLPRRRAIG